MAFLFCGAAEARDEFDAVRCGQNVASALVGRKSGDGAVAQIEARHRDLGPKNLGGDEISTAGLGCPGSGIITADGGP